MRRPEEDPRVRAMLARAADQLAAEMARRPRARLMAAWDSPADVINIAVAESFDEAIAYARRAESLGLVLRARDGTVVAQHGKRRTRRVPARERRPNWH